MICCVTQWLPFLSSLIVAAAILIGVILVNRTHREALAAADERGRQALDTAQRHIELSNQVGSERDHQSWRREVVLSAVASILDTSAQVRTDLSSCSDWDLVTVEQIDAVGAQISKTIWEQSGGTLTRLRVVAHRRIPNKCEDLLRTLTAAQHITMQRLKLHIDLEATLEEIEEMASLWHKAMHHAAEQERSLVEVARAELGLEVAKPATVQQVAVPAPAPAPAPAVEPEEAEPAAPEPEFEQAAAPDAEQAPAGEPDRATVPTQVVHQPA